MRAFRSSLAMGVLLAVSGAASVGAQQYTGTFEVPNEAGGVMTLVLQQTSDGRVAGSLSSNGVSYQVDGRIEDGMVIGSMRGTQGSLFFEAERWENELWVMLYGTDANGEPNFDDYTEIDFVEVGTTAGVEQSRSPTGERTAQGNPLAGQANGNPLGGGASDPYVGTFSDGNVTLQLEGGAGQYRGQVYVGGAAYPVQAQGDVNGIQGLIQAPDGNYQLSAQAQAQGEGLVVVSGGVRYELARRSAASGRGAAGQAPSGQVGGRDLAPGFTEDHPQVREWVQFLAGNKLTRMSSYSSGSAGGYSARTDVYLCSDRSFAMRDESSVSVDVGGAFGNSGGVGNGQGRWYVITNGQVVGLVLEFADGQTQEFRMDYQGQETYANGERVYVTPAEVCSQ